MNLETIKKQIVDATGKSHDIGVTILADAVLKLVRHIEVQENPEPMRVGISRDQLTNFFIGRFGLSSNQANDYAALMLLEYDIREQS